ncbi:MAG: DNA polymerase III subunit delta' [Micrococcaceae bacterium]
MSVWDELVGQDKTVELLKRVVASEQPNHAWLFSGAPGSGRSNVARSFAAALNCETGTGCGTCKACNLVFAGSHPDVTIMATDKVTISIEEVRKLILKSYDRPSTARWRIIIVEDADRMTERTSNVLLKALEEPAPRTIWMLCAPSPIDLQPTIRSRCQIITLAVPSAKQISKLLNTRDGIPEETAYKMAQISQGHIGVAKWLATSEQARNRRAQILSIPAQVSTVGQAVRAADFIVKIAKEDAEFSLGEFAEKEKEQVLHANGLTEDDKLPPHIRAQLRKIDADQKRRATRGQKDTLDRIMLDILSFYRDVLWYQLGVNPQYINIDMEDSIKDFARKYKTKNTLKCIEAIAVARKRLATNAAVLLTIEAMVLALVHSSDKH